MNFCSVPVKLLVVWVKKPRAGHSEDLGFTSLVTQEFSQHEYGKVGDRERVNNENPPKESVFL